MRSTLVASSIAALALVAGVSSARAETIRIAIGTQDTTINTVHAGLVIRELKLLEKHLPHTGKYKDATYDIVWKNFTSGPPLNGEMLAGKLDLGALGDFPSILNGVSHAKAGKRSVYVAALSNSVHGAGNGIVVPVDSPVQSLRDLKGKTISVPFGSAAHAMLLRAIRDLGWDPERDVQIVSQAPEVGGTSLKSHKIDAHADFVPFAELFPFRGFARKIYDGSTVKAPTSHGVVASGDFVDRYPELVVAYLEAVIEADRWIAADPERAAELVYKVAGVDAEVVYLFHGPLAIQTRDVTIKPEVEKSLHIALETLTLLKRADGPLDVERWIDDRFIRQAARNSGLDYETRLKSYASVPLGGKDARTGDPIVDPKQAAEIWVAGEAKTRHYATVASALVALGELAAKGAKTRVVLVHDRETGIKLLADKVWFVVGAPAAKGKPAEIAALLTRDAADRWAKAHGGTVTTFDAARGRAVTASVTRP